jgi:hypothetical protein
VPERSDDAVAAEPTPASVEAVPYDVSAHSMATAPLVQERVAEEPAEQAPAERAPMVAEHEVALPELDEDDIPLTWDPRPVPRPTYTMKARAGERPAPVTTPEPAAEVEHTAYEDLRERRIAGL